MIGANARIDRRRLLLGGVALAVTGSAGMLWLALRSHDTHEWIEAVVRRHLPNVRLDDVSLHRFALQLEREAEFRSRKLALALDLDGLTPAIVRIAPEVRQRIERVERHVLSSYLLASNFFRVTDPRSETIVCTGALPACGNPFAQFRHA
jgi:hypothetical protein